MVDTDARIQKLRVLNEMATFITYTQHISIEKTFIIARKANGIFSLTNLPHKKMFSLFNGIQ